ncbi:class I adenylate-forming enzyme family protein [Phytohabitans kaempferiae]|uniref:Class I adenylate-forming enzyme family protein n=1 Tax=Phytohabitans kaempferiae TaxID=1620943 RepID=A0ABV6MF84_9ACTN
MTDNEAVAFGPPIESDPVVAGRPLTLPGLLAEAAARYGAADAVVEPGRRITFGQLLDRSAVLAAQLGAIGIRPGDRVGVLVPNGVDFPVALFGVARAGAVAVLMNTFSAGPELESLLARSRAAALVVRTVDAAEPVRALARDLRTGGPDSRAEGWQAAADSRYPHLRSLLTVAETGTHARPPSPGPRPSQEVPVGQDDDAVILYTSGTTATPKAVVHRHRSACIQSYRWADLLAMRPGERLLSMSPLFWSSGLVKSLGSALSSGGCLLTMPRFTAEGALDLIERERATTLIAPPHLDQRMINVAGFAQRDLSSLRRVHRRSPLRAALRLTHEWNPGGYGLSETFTLITSFPAEVEPATLRGSEGTVLPGAALRIVDPATGAVAGTDQVGRICVGGVTLMRGYDGMPDALDADGYFPTGDLGRLDHGGRLYFSGRMDSVIRSGGANLSPAEVESALTGWHRIVRSAVVALPHPGHGQVLVLCCTPADPSVTEGEVLDFLRARLARYKVPRRVVLLDEHDFRFTATHKVDLRHARGLAVRRIVATGDDPRWAAMLEEERDAS